MDGRCETCRWWIKFPGITGLCELTMRDKGVLIHPSTRAAGDISISSAKRVDARLWLETKADFGCVQHEPKETTDAQPE